MIEAAGGALIPTDDAGGTLITVVSAITGIRGMNNMQAGMTDGEVDMVVQDHQLVVTNALTKKRRKESEYRKAINSPILCIH
jgi:hypothetical protein